MAATGRLSGCSWVQSCWVPGSSASSSQAERTTALRPPGTVRRPGGATAGSSTLTAAEVDELRRAAAVGPIDPEVFTRGLEEVVRVQVERAELVATLDRLAPAWRELGTVLNEINRALGT
jgi:hypothetical protein